MRTACLYEGCGCSGATALGFILFVIKLGIVPYAVPAIMPTWRWWLGATLVGGGLLSALLIQEAIVRSRLASEPADVFGVLMIAIVTISFIAGVAVRAMTLAMSATGIRSGYCIAVTLAGFGVTVAILVLPVLL